VKSFKLNSDEKFFINVCQAPEVPAPQDVTEEELIAILESPTPGSYRVPMSISEPRHTKDRSDKTVDVCDIAVNPKFLVKMQKSQLFNNFFLQIVAEALSEKYNVQINMEKTIILNNRKFIGTLVSHRVRNDDVQRAQPAAAGPAAITSQDTASTPDRSGKLVQEINEKDAAAIKSTRQVAGGSQDLQYKLRARVRDDSVDEIHAEIYLPNCVSINSIHWQKERTIKVNALFKQVSSQEVSLDVGEDRILVESHRHGYVFDKFVNYRLQQDRAQALFDKTSKVTTAQKTKKPFLTPDFFFCHFRCYRSASRCLVIKKTIMFPLCNESLPL